MEKIFLLVLIFFYSCGGNTDKKTAPNHSKNDIKVSNVDFVNNYKDSSFLPFWETFTAAITSSDYNSFKQMTFDSITYRHQFISQSEFIKTYYDKVFDKELLNKVSEKKINFLDEVMDTKYLPPALAKNFFSEKISKTLVSIRKSSKISEGNLLIIVLEFIKTEKGYKFSGCDKYGS